MTVNFADPAEALRTHLTGIQSSLDNIEAMLPGLGNQQSPCRMSEVRALTLDHRERVNQLLALLRGRLDLDAASPDATERWVSGRQTAMLHARADFFESLAAVAAELAALLAQEAETVTRTAIVARRLAISVQIAGKNQG